MKKNSIALILLALIVAGIMLGIHMRNRKTIAYGINCKARLGTLYCAKEQAGMEFHLKDGDVVTEKQILKYIKGNHIGCPSGGIYTINPIGDYPTCSLSKDRPEDYIGLSLHQLR